MGEVQGAVGLDDPQLWGSRLELRRARDGLCHALAGRRLELGDEIEMLLINGSWLRGTYAWSSAPTEWPSLRIEVVGRPRPRSCGAIMAVVIIPPGALLRWALLI